MTRLWRRLLITALLFFAPLAWAQSLVVYPLAGPDVLLGVAVAERVAEALAEVATEVYGPEVVPGLVAPLIAEEGFASPLGLLGGEQEETTDSDAGARLLRDNLGADAVLTGRVASLDDTLRATFFLAEEGESDSFQVSAPEDDPGLLARKATLLLVEKLGLKRPQAAYDIDLSSPYGDYIRAVALVGGGFVDEALALLEELDEGDPQVAALLRDLEATRLGEVGQDAALQAALSLNLTPLDEALSLGYFERFAETSDLPVIDTWRATLLANEGREDEAAEAFDEAARYPFGELARAAYRLSRGEAESDLADLALSDNVGVLVGLSLLANLRGEAALEQAALTRLTELAPTYLYPFERLSFIAFDEDDPLRAAQALAVAVERMPESSLYWTNLGWAYYLLDLFEQSEAASLRAIDLDGSQYIALYNLGLVQAVHGRLDEALDAYEQAVALDPEVDDEALLDLENARRRYPDEEAVQYALATLYEQEGRRAEAAEAYQRFLALDPEASFAGAAQARLELLRAPLPPVEISSGAVVGLGPALLGASPFHPGDRVFASFELYTPGAELPNRVEVRASLEREGEVLDEAALTVDIPRNAIGYVVDGIGFDLPEDLEPGGYQLVLEAEASEERRAALELSFEVAGSAQVVRQLLGRNIIMMALETGRPLYGSRDLGSADAELAETLLAELRASADAAEGALPTVESGRFEGLSGGELFSESSAQDVEAFLEYLLEGGAQDASFTFVDAYAQWALDGAPTLE